MPRLRIDLVGGVRVRAHDGTEIPISARKCQALLCCLALRPGVPLPRDFLASLLWDAADQELARSSLRQALATLRRVLPPDTLRADAKAVWLDEKLVTGDVRELHELARDESQGALLGSIDRYGDELFGAIEVHSLAFDHWARDQRHQFRRQLVDVLERVAVQCTAAGDWAALLSALERLVQVEPCNEHAHRRLMSALARLGRHTDALRQYRLCQEALRRDLDVATEPATDALLREIMRQRRAPAPNEAEPGGTATSADVQTLHRVAPTLREAVVLCVRCIATDMGDPDPEIVQRRWVVMEAQVRAAVERFGGSVDRVSQGEVLAVFGLASLAGNEADRALRAARQLTTPPPHEVSIAGCALACGIAAGQVLPASLEAPFPLTGRASGVARELARLAERNSILVATEVADRLETKCGFERVEAGAGLTARKVVACIDPESMPPTRPFVGRRAELALLTTLLEQVRRSGRARTIAVRGEPGIGKSSLIQALIRTASDLGVTVHTLNVLDFGQSATDRPIPALALYLLGGEAETSSDDRASAVERAANRGLIAHEDRAIACDLVGAALTEEAAARLAAMDNATRDRGRSRMLQRLLEHAAVSPLLLVVEDVHWAAANEIAQLAGVAASAAGLPVLVAVTSRTMDDTLAAAWRARGWGSPITTLDLAPLAEDEARELAAAHTGVPGDVVERCLGTALGHPLFLEQLLRAARVGQMTMPGSVRGLVLARIERLPPALQHALQTAAVLGTRFHQEALRHMLADPHYAAQPLEQAGLVAVEGEECRFAHALIRDAIYESLLGSTRRALHRRAATWYEARDSGLQADHLAAADDDGAAQAYLRAALENQRAYRLDRAFAYAERAVETARQPVDHCAALATLGDVQLASGRTSDACSSFRRSIELAGTGAARARAWLGLATSLRIVDRYDEAMQALDRAEAEVDPADPRRLAHIWTLRGNLHFPRGELELCLEAHGRALDFARRADSVEDVARALGGLGDAQYQRGRMRSAWEHFRQCVDLSKRHDLVGLHLAYLPMLAVSEGYMGDYAPALETCASAAAAAFELGDRRTRMLCLSIRSSIEISRAEFASSLAASTLSLALARELGARRFEAEALVLGGLARLGLNEIEAARETLEQGASLALEACPTYCAPWALAALAHASTDAVRIRKLLGEGEQMLARDCVSHNYLEFYKLGIDVALRIGDLARAENYAAALEAYTRPEPLPWADLVIARGRALVSAARNEHGAETALQEALSAARAMQCEILVPALRVAIEARASIPTSTDSPRPNG